MFSRKRTSWPGSLFHLSSLEPSFQGSQTQPSIVLLPTPLRHSCCRPSVVHRRTGAITIQPEAVSALRPPEVMKSADCCSVPVIPTKTGRGVDMSLGRYTRNSRILSSDLKPLFMPE